MSESRLQTALAAGRPIWGGWVTGPTAIGPEAFARCGFDYVGIDTQHGYLDDADAAVMLRRLEHVPIAGVVRLPTADPAPIGRVFDAGADAVIIAMVESAEQAATAVAASRYAPVGIRSFGPLRPDLGSQPGELEGRAGVYVMIETVSAVRAIDEICAVPHLAGIYVGPADLAISMGHGLAEATSAPEMIETIGRIQATASAAGLVCGVHAGSGKIAARMVDMGYQMITLASESQALHRGATMELAEASGHAGADGTGIGYS